MSSSFAPTSPGEARRLDELLEEYSRRRDAPMVRHISLERVSTALRGHPLAGQIFAYCLEIQLQTVILNVDLCEIQSLLRQPTADPLPEVDRFCQRMAVLQANSDFVFRYRALWDKIMGLFVVLAAPDKLDRFASAKSRKRAFAKIAKESGRIPDHVVADITEITKAFDSQYRTAEAHGTGSTRKWVTGDVDDWESPQANMFWAWNALNRALLTIGSMFPAKGAG